MNEHYFSRGGKKIRLQNEEQEDNRDPQGQSMGQILPYLTMIVVIILIASTSTAYFRFIRDSNDTNDREKFVGEWEFMEVVGNDDSFPDDAELYYTFYANGTGFTQSELNGDVYTRRFDWTLDLKEDENKSLGIYFEGRGDWKWNDYEFTNGEDTLKLKEGDTTVVLEKVGPPQDVPKHQDEVLSGALYGGGDRWGEMWTKYNVELVLLNPTWANLHEVSVFLKNNTNNLEFYDWNDNASDTNMGFTANWAELSNDNKIETGSELTIETPTDENLKEGDYELVIRIDDFQEEIRRPIL